MGLFHYIKLFKKQRLSVVSQTSAHSKQLRGETDCMVHQKSEFRNFYLENKTYNDTNLFHWSLLAKKCTSSIFVI